MTQPLALLFYEKLLPGSQVKNRLEDLGYQVALVDDAGNLLSATQSQKPLVLIAEVGNEWPRLCLEIARLKENPDTRHLAVVAFISEKGGAGDKTVRESGATLVVDASVILQHLPQFLEQALDLH